jgi:hypothetical protein
MKIYKEYQLIKDLPELTTGTILYWDLWQERYTDLSYIGVNDKPKVSYKKEFLDDHPEWFKPLGEPKELYEKFPDDFAEEHFYFGELRHNKMCRFCNDAQDILESKELKEQITNVFKKLYEIKLNKLLNNHQKEGKSK